MKVTIETNEEKEQEITFPYLAKANNGAIFIVNQHLPQNECSAMCVKTGGGNRKGDYDDTYSLELIKPLPKGTKVILEN